MTTMAAKSAAEVLSLETSYALWLDRLPYFDEQGYMRKNARRPPAAGAAEIDNSRDQQDRGCL